MTSALNFDTADCHILGGCDLYTTKAAGGDKKLYKNIETSLEQQYESVLKFSASFPLPNASQAAASLNLSRSSPFGPLSQISSRRTYAYLIATLNASHPDYDFSHLLRPADFRRERSLKSVMNNIDTTLYNLRPRPASAFLSVPRLAPASACPPTSPHSWGPRMWRLIDKQMSLKECSIYAYVPEQDPYEGDDGAIWSLNYFFFNKVRKRVCYLYLRGISILSHSPSFRTPVKSSKRMLQDDESSDGWATPDLGARKRARYWLGDRQGVEVQGGEGEEETEIEEFSEPKKPVVDENDNYILSDEDARSARSRSKSTVRGISEEIAESMEV